MGSTTRRKYTRAAAVMAGAALLVPVAGSSQALFPLDYPAHYSDGFNVSVRGLDVFVSEGEFYRPAEIDPPPVSGEFFYEFGDGGTYQGVWDGLEPNLSDLAVHTYAEPGNYTITQRTTLPDGSVTVESQNVLVYPGYAEMRESFGEPAARGWPGWNATPKANFSVEESEGNPLTPYGGVIDVYPGGKPVASIDPVYPTSSPPRASDLVDAQILAMISFDDLPSTGRVSTYVGVRGVDKKNEYRVKVIVNAKGKVSLELVKLVQGKEQSLGVQAVKGLTYAPGGFLTLAANVNGWDTVTLQASVTGEGTATYCMRDPGPEFYDEWQIERFDAAPGVLRDAGKVTVGSFLKNSDDPVTVRVHTILVEDSQREMPATPVGTRVVDCLRH